MRQATCHLRISAAQIRGAWRGPSWSGGRKTEAARRFAASDNASTLADALDGVLAAIVPARRLTSPFVSVTLEGPHVMAAIMPFAKLPKAKGDRRLVISQRFCREHRLEPGKVETIGAPLKGSGNESERILCLAVEKDTLRQIKGALEKRGLYADVITPACLSKFRQVESRALEKPGVALFEENGFRAILVWSDQGTLVHIVTVPAAAPNDQEGQRRLGARIRRYAQIVSSKDAPVAVYIDGLTPAAAPGLTSSNRLKLLKWPGGRREPRKAAPK